MKRGLLFFILSSVLFSAIIFSITQGQDIEFYYRTHLLVMFKPGVITLPNGANQAQPSEIANLPAWLSNLSASTGLQYIAKSNPAFVQGDTIKIRSDGRKIKTLDFSRIFYLIFPDGLNMDSISQYVKNQNEVIFVERWHKVKLDIIPSDPHFNKQWALRDSTFYNSDINADSAWDFFTGSSNVKIGILDDGIVSGHQDFGDKVSGDPTTGVHGTNVAGIAAAIGNNDTGIAGVDWNAKIFNKNLDAINRNPVGIYNAVKEAVDSGCAVLNNSWGFFPHMDTAGQDTVILIRTAFAYAYNSNVVSVASMGNEGRETLQYPAGAEGVIAVGATDHTGQRAAYSNIGNHIDVVAPGGTATTGDFVHYIYTTGWDSPSDYDYIRGTSAAAPHVAGLASLLKGYKPSLYNDDIENIIELSAKDLDITGWDKRTGWGRINAKAAFDSLQLPNVLQTFTTGGGTVSHTLTTAGWVFYGVEGVPDGESYTVQRHRVVKYVSFDPPYYSTPHVWGVGYTTTGFSPANPNFGIGFCDTVGGTVTTNGCSLKTYVYDVFPPGESARHVPTYPQFVTFGYTVLGERTLSAPGGFSASATTSPINRVILAWQECNVNEESLYVNRKVQGTSSFAVIGRLGPMDDCSGGQSPEETPDFSDATVMGSETYNYKVEAWNRHQSVPSVQETVTAKPREPRNLSATIVQTCCEGEGLGGFEMMVPCPKCPSNKVILSWQQPANQRLDKIASYKIHVRSVDGIEDYWFTQPGNLLKDTICLYLDRFYDFWVHTYDSYNQLSLASNKVTKLTGLVYVCSGPPQPKVLPPGEELTQNTPDEFALSQNYPNPFNLSTQIRYSLPQDANVQITIYNILGQKIKEFDLGYQTAGYRSIIWEGKNQKGEEVSSGLYLYRIKTGEFIETRRMTLLK